MKCTEINESDNTKYMLAFTTYKSYVAYKTSL